MSIKCQNCGTENVDNAKYCCECGNAIGFYCRKCGTFNRSRESCIACGTKNNSVDWDNASTNPKDYSWGKVYEDESGTYTADRLVFLKGDYDVKKIEIRQGTRIICDDALGSDEGWIEEYEDWVCEEAIVEEIIIPDSVTRIGDRAFDGCKSLKSIVIPDSVTQIGKEAFDGCESLQSIVIPDSVTQIASDAFGWCERLQSIVIPDSVTQIGEGAFSYCSSLKSINIPDSVMQIGDGAFTGCKNMQSIEVSKGNAIYDSRNNCNAIIETKSNILVAGCCQTTIPDSVTQIGSHAFSGCKSLQSIVIPDSVTQIGDMAFYYCSSLQAIVIPKGSKEKFQKMLPDYKHLLQEK